MLVCAACKALGEIARAGPLPLPLGDDDPQASTATTEEDDEGTSGQATEVVSTSADASAASPLLTKRLLVKRLLRLGRSVGSGKDKTTSASTRVNEAAVTCLGILSVGEFPHPCFEELLKGLCDISQVKSVELQFTVGSALCCTGMGPATDAAKDPWRWRDVDEPVSSQQLTKKLKLDDGSAAGGDGTGTTAGLARAIDVILDKWTRHPLSWRRQSAGIWLVSLVKHCSKSPDLVPRLQRIQMSFSNLLSEGDEFAQDVASKGLGLLYDIGDEATKAR